MIIYLDNCCFNRPYDHQEQEKVRLESEAKLYIQDLIKEGKLALVWPFILEFENKANPFVDQRESIMEWKHLATVHVPALDEIRNDESNTICLYFGGGGNNMRSETVIRSEGMKTLIHTLGLVEAEKFIMLIKREPFDYTEWQMHLWEDKSVDEIFQQAKRATDS
jgi:hypothetical protein